MIKNGECRQQMLEFLGVNSEWIDSGIIDNEWLCRTKTQLDNDPHPNPEHYRFNALITWVEGKCHLKQEDVETYLRLLRHEKDPAMANSALITLIESSTLSTSLLEFIATRGPHNKAVAKVIRRQRLFNIIPEGEIPEDVFQCCLEMTDRRLHEALLEHVDINISQLKNITTKGACKAVRNRAISILKAKGVYLA